MIIIKLGEKIKKGKNSLLHVIMKSDHVVLTSLGTCGVYHDGHHKKGECSAASYHTM